MEIDGFEIDPKIIKIGRKFFDMNQSNLNAIAQDGRWGLAQSEKKYQVIALDAYRPPYIPWQLTTQEFFQTVHDHLTEDGVVVMNVGSDPDDPRLIDGLIGTLQTIFPSVYLMEVPETFNFIVYATAQPTQIEDLYKNYLSLSSNKKTHPLLLNSLKKSLKTNERSHPAKSSSRMTMLRSSGSQTIWY